MKKLKIDKVGLQEMQDKFGYLSIKDIIKLRPHLTIQQLLFIKGYYKNITQVYRVAGKKGLAKFSIDLLEEFRNLL